MDPKYGELLERLGEEDSFIERKPSGANGREIWETIVSFANSIAEDRSGLVFVGVSNTGDIVGVDDPDQLGRKFANVAARFCYPRLDPLPVYHAVPFDGKKLLVIEVHRSKCRPHFLGAAYVRDGSQNLPASDALFREMLTAHCGKAATILKLKNQMVTVEHVGCQLGRYHEFAPNYHASPDCWIDDCTPHDVRFTYNHTAYSVSLEYVTLAGDAKRNRPWKIVVRHPRV